MDAARVREGIERACGCVILFGLVIFSAPLSPGGADSRTRPDDPALVTSSCPDYTSFDASIELTNDDTPEGILVSCILPLSLQAEFKPCDPREDIQIPACTFELGRSPPVQPTFENLTFFRTALITPSEFSLPEKRVATTPEECGMQTLLRLTDHPRTEITLTNHHNSQLLT